MIRSLYRYLVNFLNIACSANINHLLRDIVSFYFTKRFKNTSISSPERAQSLKSACAWLKQSINPDDGGFRTRYYLGGWTSSYPETSGYIIPTLLRYAEFSNEKEWIEICIKTGDWLIDIQKESGGWQSGYVDENKDEIVFNTGQVIRGLYALYKTTGKEKYLQSCIKACHWLSQTQEEDGSWRQHAFMRKERVYDSYVDHPLLVIYLETGIETFKETAIRNLNWILTQQLENGWFANCDNTIKHNDRPILHTISYTIDGLLNSGLLLNEKRYIQSAQKAADKLLSIFQEHKYLHGRFDRSWKPSQFMICTGSAQIAIVWHQLWQFSGDKKYREAFLKMNQILCYIQRHHTKQDSVYHGAISGSFPLWGRYEPFGYPNWSTKYLADSLLNELNAPASYHSL